MDPEQVLELAHRRVAAAEVFAVEVEDTPVEFEANRLKLLQTRATRGVALRVISQGRIGFASSSRADDAATLVEMALEVAPYGAEAKFALPGAAAYGEPEIFDPAVAVVPVDRMVALGQGLIDGVLAAAPEVMCDAGVRKLTQRLRLLNTAGADVCYRRSLFRAGVSAQRVRGTDMLWVGDDDVSCRPITDAAHILKTTLTQLERARENVPVRTAELPVIFTPEGVGSTLMYPLIAAFSGKAVLQGSSPLVGALGEGRYDERLMLVDDPHVPWRPGSRPADDEGVPSRRLTLVDHGVVREFLYDLQTAGLAGRQSTGSAHRALSTQPGVSATALTVAPAEGVPARSFDDLVAGIDEGIVVEYVIGATQGNVLGGEFSGNVVLGYKVERGRIVGRVKNTMVAGNVHSLLKRVGAFGDDDRWIGERLRTPSLLFERVNVSSTE